MPSTAWPVAIRSNSSPRVPGVFRCTRASAAAALCTSSVISSSRHGDATTSSQGLVERALVGDGERADLLDRVAEEVDAHRVLQGGREQVDDAAADAELAAALDQVDPDVGGVDECAGDVGQVVVLAGDQRDRQQVAETGHLRLQHRPDRRDHAPAGAGSGSLPARRRRTASRRPTVSERGLSRSCGRVSQAG